MTTKTASLKYSGGFHDSDSISLRVKVVERNGYQVAQLSESQKSKLSRHFCGISGCICGGAARADCDVPTWIDCVEPSWGR